jgi:hypothetical protein
MGLGEQKCWDFMAEAGKLKKGPRLPLFANNEADGEELQILIGYYYTYPHPMPTLMQV